MKSASILKIAGVYIGTVVGAGFATGQEVLQFFATFGISGAFGLALTTILFIIYGYIIIELGFKLGAASHLEILKATCGKWISTTMDFVITFFLFGALTAMFAGTGALFVEQFGLPIIIGCLIMAIITSFTVLKGLNGVLNSISFVAPFLVISVIGICLYSIMQTSPNISTITSVSENPLINNWFMSSILYVSYNILLSVAVLGPLGAESVDKKSIAIGSFLGGLGLGVTSLMIYLALSAHSSTIISLEVPLLYIAEKISPQTAFLFSIILIAEVYTTAVGALYGLTARLFNNTFRWKTIVLSATALAFFASLLGFSNLVKYLYPIVGYSGLVLLACLLISKKQVKK